MQISIGQSQGWTTVLGEKFNWETIGESARSLSNLISSLVLAIGYFDDDVRESVEQLETVVPAPLILKYDWVEEDESLGREFVQVRRDRQTIKS
ncbi:hypothetical protein MHH60_27035 [Paenibacillus sp. FSL H7-0716]|uniref:Uncharacterized protein n=1 Tax=Paenibacillus odorifer TaxID=189426 RepID=A0AB36JH86_9BACL|nr:hypothetical protein [Paenibacillus odorifer]OME19462.1 hypothetical protein BSK47_15570 [Paenibacillus odorifer]